MGKAISNNNNNKLRDYEIEIKRERMKNNKTTREQRKRQQVRDFQIKKNER